MPRPSQPFATDKTEGLLLPLELITRVADLDAKLPAIRPEDYHLAKGERINEATNRAWNQLTTLWAHFPKELETLPQREAATGPTRKRWLLPLLQELNLPPFRQLVRRRPHGADAAVTDNLGQAVLGQTSGRVYPGDNPNSRVRMQRQELLRQLESVAKFDRNLP